MLDSVMMADILEHLNKEEIIDLASELIKIPRFTGKETPAAEFMQDFFERNGFKTEMQEVQLGRKQVIARLKGSGSARGLHITHQNRDNQEALSSSRHRPVYV